MRMRIWGCRGSIAAPGASTKRYGGNTSCVEIRPASGEVVILDAGTGIRELGARLVEEGVGRIHLLLTHLHVDHLEGLGMFAPIYEDGTELHIWGPASPVASLEDRIATYFSPPRFPLGSTTTTHPRASGRSTRRASPRTRSCTPDRRSDTGSRRADRCSPTSRTTSRRSAPISARTHPSGSRDSGSPRT